MTQGKQTPRKRYHGVQNGTYDRQVFVEDSDGESYELAFERSMEYVQHSPTGFNWGYGGSGPAQLAFGLLLDATDDVDIAKRYYQFFKWDVIAGLSSDTWTMPEQSIHDWIAERGQELSKN